MRNAMSYISETGDRIVSSPPVALKMIMDQKKAFFGIRADSSVINMYRTLLMKPEDFSSRGKKSFNTATTR